jgi:hypothetical protein
MNEVTTPIVTLCGLVVSVLAIGPKICGFKPGRGWWMKEVLCSQNSGAISRQFFSVSLLLWAGVDKVKFVL